MSVREEIRERYVEWDSMSYYPINRLITDIIEGLRWHFRWQIHECSCGSKFAYMGADTALTAALFADKEGGDDVASQVD
jgi:hypothetical protein